MTSKQKKALKEHGFHQVKELYKGEGYGDIYDAYSRPSVYKVRAWWRCEDICASLSGYGLTVSGRNCSFFSAMFNFEDEDGVEYVAKITPQNCYFARA